MTPPAPRAARPSPRLLAALVAALTATTVAACQPSASRPQPVARETNATASPTPTLSPTSTPTPIPTPTPSLAPSATTRTPQQPHDLNYYLDRLPTFPAAPAPAPVTLSRNDGESAFVYEIPTSQRVAFITIDDGINRHPMARDLIAAAGVPVTLFLTTNYVQSNPGYFRALRDTGLVTIQNHTVWHPDLTRLSYQEVHDQLCWASNNLEGWFGQRPTYYRPPFGNVNATVRRAAWDCGLRAGFHWRETVDQGVVRYQRDSGRVHPGDIILMHFRPAFPDDFLAALTAIKNSGLVPARLEDYVRVNGVPQPPTPDPTPSPDPSPTPGPGPTPSPDLTATPSTPPEPQSRP